MKLFSSPPRPTGAQRPASDTAQQRPLSSVLPSSARHSSAPRSSAPPSSVLPNSARPSSVPLSSVLLSSARPSSVPLSSATQQAYASQWTDDAARPRRSAPDDRRRVQQPAPAPAGKHGRKAKKAKKPKKKKSLGRRLLILFLVLAILAGLYLTAVYSDIPFIAKWRTAYIQTAMNTLSHQWLATAFIPRSVIDKVLAEMEAAREAQIGINSEWGEASPSPATRRSRIPRA